MTALVHIILTLHHCFFCLPILWCLFCVPTAFWLHDLPSYTCLPLLLPANHSIEFLVWVGKSICRWVDILSHIMIFNVPRRSSFLIRSAFVMLRNLFSIFLWKIRILESSFFVNAQVCDPYVKTENMYISITSFVDCMLMVLSSG